MSVVPGHCIRRLGLCRRTETTVNEKEVWISYKLTRSKVMSGTGSLCLSKCIDLVISCMDVDEFTPEHFAIESSGEAPDNMECSLTLGNKFSSEKQSGLLVNYTSTNDKRTYSVPTIYARPRITDNHVD
jgi:hypothetical protein